MLPIFHNNLQKTVNSTQCLYGPNIVKHSRPPLIQMIITIPPNSRFYYYLYFTDEETVMQNHPFPTITRGKASNPNRPMEEPGLCFHRILWFPTPTLGCLLKLKHTYAQRHMHMYNYTYVHMFKHFTFKNLCQNVCMSFSYISLILLWLLYH